MVVFYNILIKEQYFPERWLNLVAIILENSKGPMLGKLRSITLIEGDLQIMMQIHLKSDKEEMIEKDQHFSKVQYGARKNFLIETALLEKQLIFDNSLIEIKPTIYALTDLQSCYDRQLPNIGSIVEEVVGRNRYAMKLYTKLMPNFRHYVSTAFGVSTDFYGGEDENLTRTRQDNKFSRDICRDVSCLIIKQLEKKTWE